LIGGDHRGVVLTPAMLQKLARSNANVQTRTLTDTGHFLPMEQPEQAVALIRDALDQP
jgi:pimeloyl-ACP methyl ester carboxylesterase